MDVFVPRGLAPGCRVLHHALGLHCRVTAKVCVERQAECALPVSAAWTARARATTCARNCTLSPVLMSAGAAAHVPSRIDGYAGASARTRSRTSSGKTSNEM